MERSELQSCSQGRDEPPYDAWFSLEQARAGPM